MTAHKAHREPSPVHLCVLRAGDILVSANGQYVVVEKVQHEILETPIKVYNFEVADFHTYYVGEGAVLVHNTCVVKENGVRKHRGRFSVLAGCPLQPQALQTTGFGVSISFLS